MVPTPTLPVPVKVPLGIIEIIEPFWFNPPAAKVKVPVPVIEPLFVPVPPCLTSITVPLQVPLVIVPTPAKLELTTLEASVVPVNVPASAVNVISEVPSKGTPFIFLPEANFVAVVEVPAVIAVVAVAAFPVILPPIGLVTVKLFNIPTLVKLE